MKLKLTMTPLGPYFLGSERNASYQNEQNSQQSELNPYFIRSSSLPSQSSLLGILRYLGIQNPKPNFHLDPEDIQNVGKDSFHLLSDRKQSFGRIHRISPLMLTDSAARRYIPAPRNRLAVELKEGRADFTPFDEYITVKSLDGIRYLPTGYNEKDAFDGADFLCLEDGSLLGSPFQTQVRVGINRQVQHEKKEQQNISGFFKKEYVLLNPEFSFLFYADVDDAFQYRADSVAYVGQGRAPFAVHIERASESEAKISIPSRCLPERVTVDGGKAAVRYAVAVSDCYYPDQIAQLRNSCSLMISESRDYRVFTTNYEAKSHEKRYQKDRRGLKLIKAGSVFVFFGGDGNTPDEQMHTFQALCQHSHAPIAGFNQFYFSDGTAT